MAAYLRSLYYILIIGEDEKKRIDLLAGILVGISPIVHILLTQGYKAAYGRYSSSNWGYLMNVKLAWLLQELPSFVIPVYILMMADFSLSTPATILLLLFIAHYFNRTFIYSLSLNGGKPTPLSIFLMAIFFTTFNGYMQAIFLVKFSNYREEYLMEWNFVVGVAVFIIGSYINRKCDKILRNLRKPGETGYKIPQGSMFNYVSAGNLWGEALQWVGFALACWSLQGFAYAVFAVMYLSGRSYSHHLWYLKKFDDYPKERCIFIPFIL